MWNPTHVQFTVLRARNLVSKGKGGNNDVFVTIQLGKEKYQTTTIKKAHNPEWFEECDLPIPTMDSAIRVHVFHRGKIADECLGFAEIPLTDHQANEHPKSQWVDLKSKPKKNGVSKHYGELEVRLTFHIQNKAEELQPLVRKNYTGSFKHLATSVAGKLKRSQSLIHRKDKPQKTITMSSPAKNDSLSSSQVLEVSREQLTINTNSNKASKSVDNIFRQVSTPLTVAYRESKKCHGSQNTSPPQLQQQQALSLDYKILRPPIATITETELDTVKSHHRSLELLAADKSTKESFEYRSYTLPQVDLRASNQLAEGATLVRNRRPKSAFVPIDCNRLEALLDKKLPGSGGTSLGDGGSGNRGNHRSKRLPRRIRKPDPYDQDADSESESIDESNSTLVSSPKTEEKPVGTEKCHVHQLQQRIAGLQLLQNAATDNADDKCSNSIHSLPKCINSDLMRHRPSRENLRRLNKEKNRRFTVQGINSKRPLPLMFNGRISESADFFCGYHSDSVPLPDDLLAAYKSMPQKDLVGLVINQKAQLIRKDQYIRGLETYIDELLVGVIEENPQLLQKTFQY